ncbi:MAG: hypothetical protein NVS4B3_14670 [Gemmatimonadaceae bacterium]
MKPLLGGAPITNCVLVVTADRIVTIAQDGVVAIPKGAGRIDLGNATLLPGFIDAHTHVAGCTLGDRARERATIRDHASFAAILGVEVKIARRLDRV